MKEVNRVCAVPLGAISMYPNHSPLRTVDMTLGGEPIQVNLFRGSKFVDEEGEHVEPLAWLSLQEYKRIVSMLGSPEEGVERTYPFPWEEAEALLYEWRQENQEEVSYV